MKGFTFCLGHTDVFVQTDKKNKTKKLAEQILLKMLLPANSYNIDALLYMMQRAECEVKRLGNGREYYDIHGDNFGGRGGFLDEDNTIIVNLI